MSQLAEMLQSRAGDVPAPIVELSFLEVYNDNLYDLLDSSRQLPRLRSSEKHVVPQGLTRRRCELDQMEQQVHSWLREEKWEYQGVSCNLQCSISFFLESCYIWHIW
eukprot:g31740.t1